MATALRTQIYLTAAQRRGLDEIARREDVSLAELIRAAVDAFLSEHPVAVEDALQAAFGAVPDAAAPSRRDWEPRERRVGG